MKKHILKDGRNLCNLVKNNCVFKFEQEEIYYIISDNLITREKTNIADLAITEEVMREYRIKRNLSEWADDCSLDNGATQESDDLRKQFTYDLAKSFPIFKEYFEDNNEYELYNNIDYIVNNNLKYLISNKEKLTPGLADNVKKWVSKWRDKHEVRNKCYYFTFANSEFPFSTDWGEYFFDELNDEDKKTLIKKIKENDFNIWYGIEDENENTTAIKLTIE